MGYGCYNVVNGFVDGQSTDKGWYVNTINRKKMKNRPERQSKNFLKNRHGLSVLVRGCLFFFQPFFFKLSGVSITIAFLKK